MSVFRQVSWAAASAVTLAVARFTFSALLARRVPEELFGQYAYGQWVVDVSFLLCSLGVTGAISRYIAEHSHDPGMLSTIIGRWRWMAIGLPILAAGSVSVGARLSEMDISSTGLGLLVSWGLASGLWAMHTSALIGLRRFDLIFAANVIVGGIMIAGVLLLPRIEDSTVIFGLMTTACLFGASVGMIRTSALGRGEKRAIPRSEWIQMGIYAINCWIAALVSGLVWSRGEFPIVKTMLGDLAIAHYAAAFTIFGAAVQGIMLGVSGVAPHLTKLWGLDRKTEAIRLARKVMDLQLVVTAMGTLFLIFFSTQLLSIAFTDSYRGAADLLVILCLGLPAFVVSNQSFLLQLETNARFNRNVIFYGLFALYILAFSLIPILGLPGAAIARIGAMGLIGVLTVYRAVRYWGSEVASPRNLASVVAVLSISASLSYFAVDPNEVSMRFVMMVSAMGLSLVFIRNPDGGMAVRSLYREFAMRISPG